MDNYIGLLQNVLCKYWDKASLTNYKSKSYTNADIASYILRMHILFEKLGIERGQKMAICGKNSAEWAMAFLAITSYRAVVVPILSDFTIENITALVDHSDSMLLFTDKKISSEMDHHLMPKLKAVIEISQSAPMYVRDEELYSAFAKATIEFDRIYPSGPKPSDIHFDTSLPDDLAVINYTSGTTGSPKGIMLSYKNITSNINFGHKLIPNSCDDNAISILPLAHMYGLAIEFLYTYLGGCHLYFLGRTPTPSILMSAFAEVKPYILVLVPLVIEKIFKNKVMPKLAKPWMKIVMVVPFVRRFVYKKIHDELMGAFGGKVREIVIGGAAISRPVEILMHRARIPYTIGFGMTECAPLIGYEKWRKFILGSCGKVVDGMMIRVDSSNPERIVGELQVKGDNVTKGCYKNDDITKTMFTEDGWLCTGDLGIIDKHGNIFIKGRSKCMILSSNGQNIYPEEIETKLNNMPSVAESIVVERNKQLVAIISLQVDDERDDNSQEQLSALSDEIRKTINKMLPNYSQISKIEIKKDGFEHTPKHSIKRYLYR